jgi:hypothetical protein
MRKLRTRAPSVEPAVQPNQARDGKDPERSHQQSSLASGASSKPLKLTY